MKKKLKEYRGNRDMLYTPFQLPHELEISCVCGKTLTFQARTGKHQGDQRQEKHHSRRGDKEEKHRLVLH